ncbi:hypothetical protein N1851_026047 [Merluccius polli]|uniref:MADF domain-containing protein n=2 Tax=Merluccius polli TaxID=89951 RepID=A0AA47MCJ0_MERPO|nr:hypothetical protein N1851_026047 [Merluccius polli]
MTTMTAAKKAKEMGRWTHEAETRFVEMWQQYPVLYDVTSKDYHDRVKKEKCWQEIAVDLELPVAELQLKAASLRTQYGKILRPKASGSGYKDATPRQIWIKRTLGFLRPYMSHRTSQTTLNSKTIIILQTGQDV